MTTPAPRATGGAAPRAPGAARLRGRLGWAESIAAVLVAAALAVSRGEYDPLALALVTGALLLAFAAAVAERRGPPAAPRDSRAAARLLAVAVVGSCTWHVFVAPGSHLVPAQPTAFRLLAACAGALGATYLLARVPEWLCRSRFVLAAACFVGMASVVLHASPSPFIDVWWIQQIGANAFLHGVNPYAITYPNYYGETRWFAPELIEDGRIAFYPYPPLTLVVGAVGFAVARDVRIALAAMMLLAAWSVRRAGGRARIGEPAALLLLLQPVSFLVVEKAWSEPVVLAATGLTVLAMRRGARGGGSAWSIGVAGGLLAVSKQFSPLVAVPLAFALPPARRTRAIAIAAGLVALALVPFAVWDARELWRDLVESVVLQPFRFDALSWLVPAARALGRPLPSVVGVAALGIALGATLRPGASLAQAVRASAVGLVAFVVFNKQAFCNYFWLAVGLLLLAAVLSEAEPSEAEPEDPRAHQSGE